MVSCVYEQDKFCNASPINIKKKQRDLHAFICVSGEASVAFLFTDIFPGILLKITVVLTCVRTSCRPMASSVIIFVIKSA